MAATVKGPLAEWLGKALQKLLQRFESARDLKQRPGYAGVFYIMTMFYRITHIGGILACIGLIVSCFLPWAYYQQIGETFTGFHVSRFSTGTYYGRAGIFISVMTAIIFVLMMLPRIWGKRVNLFLAALLFAYCIRTYIVFTSSLFEGDVQKRYGIYLVIIFSLMVLISCIFPKIDARRSA